MEENFVFNPEKYGFIKFGHVNIDDELWISKKQFKDDITEGIITLRYYTDYDKWGIFRDGERIYFEKVESEETIKSFLLDEGILNAKSFK